MIVALSSSGRMGDLQSPGESSILFDATKFLWHHRLMVRTSALQAGNTGSTPVGATIELYDRRT